MELRKHLGEVIDQVRLQSETVILERAGKPVAKISPPDSGLESESIELKKNTLNDMLGCGSSHPRSEDIDKWLEEERSW